MDALSEQLHTSPLGSRTIYKSFYSPELLFPIPRALKREALKMTEALPFTGLDLWTAFEISWLNPKGKPQVALGDFRVPCESPRLVESKSFKLYLNSFNDSNFESFDQVSYLLVKDLSKAAGTTVQVRLSRLEETENHFDYLPGTCLDDLDVPCTQYHPQPEYLLTETTEVEEAVYSNLLKSNCPMTGQPDWGTIWIKYKGRKINSEGLLRYIVSFRSHNDFHEHCVETAFLDILARCAPRALTVYARYTRRGGLDINVIRTNDPSIDLAKIRNQRLIRQ